MNDFAKLKPESIEKLKTLVRLKSCSVVARLLRTSTVTIELVCSSMGGAKKNTIKRLEEALAQL
jgi:hypothetical protein